MHSKWQPRTPGEWLALFALSTLCIIVMMATTNWLAWNSAPEGSTQVQLQVGKRYRLEQTCPDNTVRSAELTMEITTKHWADIHVSNMPTQEISIAESIEAGIGCNGEVVPFADMKTVNQTFNYADILLYPAFRIEEVQGAS